MPEGPSRSGRERRRYAMPAEIIIGFGKDHAAGKVEVVPGGKRMYLWIGHKDGACVALASGPARLRKLAKAILAEVGSK